MKIFPILLAIAAGTTTAVGQQLDRPSDRSLSAAQARFSALDHNGDERLSKREAEAEDGLPEQFASMDDDEDGYLSKPEYTSMAGVRPPPVSSNPY